jgi:hypothetical protein
LNKRLLRKKKFVRLPVWFNVNKYEGIRRLDAIGWHQHLSARQYCAEHVDLAKSDLFDKQMFPEAHDPAIKLLAALRKDPVDFPTAIASLAAHPEVASSFEYSPARLSDIQRQNQVHSLTIDELFSQERAISAEKRKAVKEYADQTLGKLLTFGSLRRAWMSEPVYRHTTQHGARGLVMVDLELLEHLLKKQFEEWLVEMRARKVHHQHDRSSKHIGPSRKEVDRHGIAPVY